MLGGISPIDPGFIAHMKAQRVLENLDAVAVHGFPLDWNHWNISEWPDRIATIEAVTDLPVWVSRPGLHRLVPRRSRHLACAGRLNSCVGVCGADSLVQSV